MTTRHPTAPAQAIWCKAYHLTQEGLGWHTIYVVELSEIYRVCVQTHKHKHTHAHEHAYTHVHTHVHVHTHTHTHTHTYTRTHTHTCPVHICSLASCWPIVANSFIHAAHTTPLDSSIIKPYTHTQMHEVTPLPFFPLPPPTYIHPIFPISPFSLSFGQTADIQMKINEDHVNVLPCKFWDLFWKQ